MTAGEDFMYDTELVSTDGKFQLSQMNMKNPQPLNPFRFAVVYWNHGGFQYSNASHKPMPLFPAVSPLKLRPSIALLQ